MRPNMTTIDSSLLDRARVAAREIAPRADAIEEARRLPPDVVAALVEAGVFALAVPRSLGGHEATAATLLAVIEEIARADGAAGWCAMIGASSALMSAYLDETVAREVYGEPGAITCGVFAPMGRAIAAPGGFRVSGRWPFASGCEHSGWRMGGAIVEGASPLPSGAPDVRSMLFRADETRILDTWRTSGLRGTGSHDLEVADVFVPTARSFSFFSDAPREQGALYRLPFFGVLAAAVAAVTLGIGRHALESVIELAQKKHPLGAKRSLAHRELVQLRVAQAEAKLSGARALLFETLGAVEHAAEAGDPASLAARARLRLAAAHAASESAAAVDLAYHAGGATSIYEKSPLQRCFRDVHVATQHAMVGDASATLAGRVLLGLESDTSTL